MKEKSIKVEMTPEEYARIKKEYSEDKAKGLKEKKLSSFLKWGTRAKLNKTLKKPDEIVVFLLNLKKQLELVTSKIYGGNFLVIRNHIYRYNPHRVFSFGKWKAVIAREFDRELVGIDDYQELMLKDFASENPGGRVNIDDPVLIKAIIQARLAEKPSIPVSLTKWIVIGLIIVGVIVGFFWISGKGKAPVTPPTAP